MCAAYAEVLREEIDNLRRERVAFDNVYKKMEKELHEKKKEMANIIEISNIAYEARDQVGGRYKLNPVDPELERRLVSTLEPYAALESRLVSTLGPIK